MSNHYIWLKQWIKHTGEAIKISFNDPLEEIRLRAAKCLDILGNSMNTFLLSQSQLNKLINYLPSMYNIFTIFRYTKTRRFNRML